VSTCLVQPSKRKQSPSPPHRNSASAVNWTQDTATVCAIRRPSPRFPLVLLSSSRLSSSLFLSPPHLCSALRELVVSVSDIFRRVLTLYLEPRFTLATSNTRPRKKIQSETSHCTDRNNACHWPSAARRVFEVPQLPARRNCHIVAVPTRSVVLSCAPGYFVAATLTHRRLRPSSPAARLPSCLSLPLSETRSAWIHTARDKYQALDRAFT
jgi:hypothetical protein